MLSATNVPPGCGSIQAEVYFSSKYRPLTQAPEDLIEPVIRDLRRSGTIREHDKILTSHARVVRHANVIFDLDRSAALETVHVLSVASISSLGIPVDSGIHQTWMKLPTMRPRILSPVTNTGDEA